MAIKGNQGLPIVTIGASDTVIYQKSSPVERYAVTGFNVFNTSASQVTVNVFISPNTTSASGKKVSQMSIPAASDVDITAVIGQGYGEGSNLNIIATASTGAVLNATMTLTTYDSGD